MTSRAVGGRISCVASDNHERMPIAYVCITIIYMGNNDGWNKKTN